MMASPNQQRRLLELLDKLDRLKRGDPQAEQDRNQRITSMDLAGMDGPEHRDIVTLHGNGLISSRHFMASHGKQLVIRRHLRIRTNHRRRGVPQLPTTPAGTRQNRRTSSNSQTSRVFIIHGTDPNGYVSQVERCAAKRPRPIQDDGATQPRSGPA